MERTISTRRDIQVISPNVKSMAAYPKGEGKPKNQTEIAAGWESIMNEEHKALERGDIMAKIVSLRTLGGVEERMRARRLVSLHMLCRLSKGGEKGTKDCRKTSSKR